MASTPEAAPTARQYRTHTGASTSGEPVASGERAVRPGKAAERDFRPDIQGLRAIAVALVVFYHLYPSLLPGGFVGVDVFFVISGFLITGHLWRGYAKTGQLSLVDFWGRRARRLVPAAAVVLAVTWVASRLMLPPTRLAGTATQIRASALYYQNWQLAHDAVDYLKSNSAASPVQHFWSLSVEEQFYLVWPLLFLLAALIAGWTRPPAAGDGKPRPFRRPAGLSGHAVVVAVTSVLVVASLAYSVYDTKADPAAAYFVTTTRMWELGTGGLLALVPAAAEGRLARHGWLGWAGLAMIAASQFVIRQATAFPGWIALLPVLGATAVIAGGSSRGRLGPWRLASAPPMVFLGGISYALYLWHWPVITVFTASHDYRPPGVITGPVIAVVSVALAWLTKVTVEDRVRLAPFIARHSWRSVSTALAAAVPVALVTTFLVSQPGPWDGRLGPGYPGAAALASRLTGKPASVPRKRVLPPPDQTALPDYWADGCLQGEHVGALKACVYGETTSPALTVALVGDSMAGNWWAPLRDIAVKNHWRLVTELHATCDWTAAQLVDDATNGFYPACHAWGVNVLNDLVTRVRPDVVITTSFADMTTVAHPRIGSPARADVGAGEAAYWSRLEAHGISVVAISETPTMEMEDIPGCVAHYGAAATLCATSRADAIDADPPTSYAARLLAGRVPVIDMNPFLCGQDQCPPVVGNVLVYFDGHHITQAYGKTLAPFLERRLLAASPVLRSAAG